MELSITGEALENIFHHTNHYTFITQPNFSRESDAKLTHKTETKAFIGLLCRAANWMELISILIPIASCQQNPYNIYLLLCLQY